jgi:integrase
MANSEDKWINVDPRTKKLSLRFRVRGFSRQFFISSGLKDTKSNRAVVRTKRDAIMTDIALGRFDGTLKSYQFLAAAEPLQIVADDQVQPHQLDLQEIWERFTEFQSTQLEKTTILNRYYTAHKIIKKLPTRQLNEARMIRDWLLVNYSHFSAWDNLSGYSRCCKWAVDSGLISENPFEKLQIQKPKHKGIDRGAFTLEQRDIIIKAFEEHPNYRYYAPLIKFLFWTGCRPGEVFALTWEDISKDCRQININKSRNFKGITKTTKNGKQRVFPVKSGSKIHHLLIELTSKPASNKLVFTTKTGKPLNSDIFLDFWKETRVEINGKTYHYPGVVEELADQGKTVYLKPYATRHTFATWAITSGVSVDKVAFLIGDTVETVLKYYCHPEVVKFECPDF